MRTVTIIVLVLSAIAVSPHARAADELKESDKAMIDKAIGFASHWFSLVSAGDYATAYVTTTSNFQKHYPLAKWVEENQQFAVKAGKLLEHNFSLGTWERNPAGAPLGTYFLIYAYAKFVNIERFRMEIRIRLDGDENFQLLDYQRLYLERETENALREMQRKFEGARFPAEKVTKEEMEGYYKEVSALAGWRGFQKDNTFVIREAESDTGYIFTTSAHLAHPAVIKLREMVYQGTKGVGKTGHFAGNEAAYRNWFATVGPVSPQNPAPETDQPIILVDSIPSDAVLFIQEGDVKLPPEKLKTMSDAEVEKELASLISSQMMPFAKENHVRFVCLLPVKGKNVRAFSISGSEKKLMLSLQNPAFAVVLYQGGHVEKSRISYSTGKPSAKRSTTSASFQKIALPPDMPVSLWVYFNLTRIQDWAAKAGSSEVFLKSSGAGKTTPVIIPGMKEPLHVFVNDSVITATWYVDPNKPDT